RVHAIAVVLDFVQPIVTRRCFVHEARQLRLPNVDAIANGDLARITRDCPCNDAWSCLQVAINVEGFRVPLEYPRSHSARSLKRFLFSLTATLYKSVLARQSRYGNLAGSDARKASPRSRQANPSSRYPMTAQDILAIVRPPLDLEEEKQLVKQNELL